MIKSKKIIALAIAATVSCSLPCGCAKEKTVDKYEPTVGKEVQVLSGVQLDYDNAFFDGFDNGVEYNNWYIGDQAWGAGGNGGVIPENVGYTDDGVLVLSGNGDYYLRGEVSGVGVRKDGSLTGASLISKFKTGAGRYEIKMKVLPRLGACSAFWTYGFDHDTNGNHEIDIELPGGKSTGVIGFDNVLNTNYVTESDNISQDPELSDVMGTDFVLNDGQWHTFGFDWYTLEPDEYDGDLNEYESSLKGEDTKREESHGKVVYYIDGVVTAVSDLCVPYYECRLWLGVWFPNTTGFVGDANFENDYMYVDYVSYVPFKEQPIVEFDPSVNGYAAAHEYPTKPTATESVNMIANGTFEHIKDGLERTGWTANNGIYSSSDEQSAITDFEEYYESTLKAEIAVQAETQVKDKAKDSYKKSHDDSIEGFDEYYEEYKLTDEYEKAIANAVKQLKRKAQNAYLYPNDILYTVSSEYGEGNSIGVKIENSAMLTQMVDSLYGGFNIELNASVKGDGKIVVRFLQSQDDASVIEERVIDISSHEWITSGDKFTCPSGTRYVSVSFKTGYQKSLCIDNVRMEVVYDGGQN